MFVAGIDCGAKYTKAVVMKAGRILGKGIVLTGMTPQDAAQIALNQALEAAGISRTDIEKIGNIGKGKESTAPDDTQVDPIKAMSKGARYFFPAARTVVDVGAEEARTSRMDEAGNPIDFVINERCAAGAGAFIEAMARALEVTIEEMGRLCLQSQKEIAINAQCAVFTESEVVGLIHANTDKADISKAIHDAVAARIVSMVRRIGVIEDLVMIGGLSRNPGLTTAMQRELRMPRIAVPEDPEYGAAVGAALVTAEEDRG